MNGIQLAYSLGRNEKYDCGGVSTHAYYEVRTKLDPERYDEAFNKVIKRQPMLHTVLYEDGTQEVLEEIPEFRSEVIDISDKTEEEQREVILGLRAKISHRMFPLGKWPMFGVVFLKLSENEYEYVFDIDLLVSDGSSISILFQETLDFYDDPDHVPAPLEYTFRQFVEDSEKKKTTSLYRKDLAYWEEMAADVPDAPHLGCMVMKDEPTTFSRFKFFVSEDKWKAIRAVLAENDLSPTHYLSAAYAHVLGYWADQPEFTINYTLSDRRKLRSNKTDLIGDFTSIMPLSLKLDEFSRDSLLTSSAYVKRELFNTYRHTHIDGVQIMSIINKQRGDQDTALFPYVFTSMLYDEGSLDWVSRFGNIDYSISQTPQVYLDCQVSESGGGLVITWDYANNRFEPGSMERIFEDYKALLMSVIDGGQSVGDILCADDNDKKLVEDYNATAYDIPVTTLTELVNGALSRFGDNVCIKDENVTLTYKQVDELSGKKAAELSAAGIGAGDFVGVCGERCADTVIDILAAVRCGAAYIPINPEHPEKRREFILQQSNAKALMNKDGIKYYGDHSGEACSEHPEPDDMAYVIYTSGSTGTPKGVMISQDAVCNTIIDVNRRFSVTEDDVFIAISSFCFDLSVYDIFGSLQAGAAMVIAPDARDISHITELVNENGVTVWNTVPAIMSLFMNEIGRKNSSTGMWHQNTGAVQLIDADEAELRLVMLSGDWIPLDLPEKIRGQYPDVELYSLGGATEASIWSIFYPITEVRPEWNSIPYGVPLSNQSIYILDRSLELCPSDVQGEIFIGGRGVASGYQNEPEKTANAFIDHPQLGMIYRTGDYGIMRRNGYVEFRGRKDQQVKISGHRIELGEIEHVIKSHSCITDAVVVPFKNEYGKEYIAAYYVASQNISKDELKELAKDQLPEYMIPQRYCRIDAIPLSANGKVDRKHLPEIKDDEVLFVAPRDAVEKKIAEIWSGILETGRVGVLDNFFEIGGDSVSMVRISGMIEEEFGVKIPLKEFLTGSTVEAIAAYIRSHSSGIPAEKTIREEEPVKVIKPEDESEPFPLTDVQMAYLIGSGEQFELGGVSAHAYYEIDTELDIDRFGEALNTVIKHQPMLRAVMIDGGSQKIIPDTGGYTIDVTDVRGKPQEEQDTALAAVREQMSHQKFDPYTWPLFAFRVVKYGDNKQRLYIGFDLLIADGTSMRILVQELLAAYHGRTAELSPLEYSFRDYIYDKQTKMSGASYQKAKEFWQEKIKSLPSAAPIIREVEDKNFKPHFNRLAVHIAADEWQGIKNSLKKRHITPSAYLCTTFAELLSFWSDQPQHTLNVTIFNRYPFHKDVQSLIGDFTSVLLLDTDSSGDKDFWKRAEETQGRMLEYIENSVYEGISVIRDLSRERSMNMSAVMPIVFTSMIFNDERFDHIEDFGEAVYSVSQTPQVYLDCQVMETKDSLSVTWDYVEEMFDADMIGEMFSQFGSMIRDIDKKLELKASDRDTEAVERYNDTAEEFPEMILSDMLRKSFDTVPDRPAVRYEGTTMTYAELDSASEEVAEKLRKAGVGAGDSVGLIAKREPATIVNIVGIVKSGAAYVPINAEYPENRKEYILKHSKCACWLSGSELTFSDTVKPSGRTKAAPDDKAYIIYTSGSTGEPKGVVITNDAVCNTIVDINSRFGIDKDDVFIGISSFCFDLSVFDVFGSLCSGASLVIAPDARDIPHIADLVETEEVTVWNTVPALMELYIAEQQKRSGIGGNELWHKRNDMNITVSLDDPGLRVIMMSGDWIPLSLPDQIRESFPEADIYSLGGATEASIWSIYYKIGDVDPSWSSIPYGYPLANQTIYVLNYDCQLCPVGVIGEIYIGGRGVAKEYNNDPGKTADAFIDHPQYGRLYRTGDFGVMTANGYVEFKGRRDFQVKIRGHRIELGEIENVMNGYEGISKAVADVYEKNGKLAGICAYYVTETEDTIIDEDKLREYCGEYLTQYMIPNHFIRLEEIPLSANGKVNKKALPQPTASAAAERVLPRTDTERELYELWREEIGEAETETLGIDDAFFDLGGDSVKAIKIYSKLREKYAISVRDLFENQTIRSLAEVMANKQTSGDFVSTQINEIRAMYKESLKMPEIVFDRQAYIDNVLASMDDKLKAPPKSYSKILLTGATGYLGTHVLYELLTNTDADIYAIIRGQDVSSAAERLKNKLIFYKNEDLYSRYSTRIHIINGDLTKNRLGMIDSDYESLYEADCIIHTAAKVTHFSSYDNMYAQNVATVANVLELAKAGGNTPIYHISSSQVSTGELDDSSRQVICGETDNITGQKFHDFYSQTKYEAEQVLFEGREQGVPVTMIRLGNVVFQSGTGKFQENMQDNAFYSLLRVMLLVKKIPDIKENVLEFTFVDKAAELVRKVVCRGLENCTLHAVNPHKTTLDFFADAIREGGVPMEKLSYDKFLDTLEEHCKLHQDEGYIQNVIVNKNMLVWHKKTQVHFVSDASEIILKEIGFEWPEVTGEMIRKMYRYAVSKGYFPDGNS